jgi:hypothetical protein
LRISSLLEVWGSVIGSRVQVLSLGLRISSLLEVWGSVIGSRVQVLRFRV